MYVTNLTMNYWHLYHGVWVYT